MTTVDQENTLELERQMAYRRQVRDAFVATFGPPGQPTVHGAIMLEYIDRFCTRGRVQRVVDNDGQTDVPATFLNVGRREVADLIHDVIAWKETRNVDSSKSGP